MGYIKAGNILTISGSVKQDGVPCEFYVLTYSWCVNWFWSCNEV